MLRLYYYCLLLLPEMFPGIGVLPGPDTESHVVNMNRGTPAPLDSRSLMSRRGESPDFPNIMSCFRIPIAAGPQMTH
jgi:hypothetical protein